MFAYRLDLEYEGTRYSGWQAQANARTVSGELRRALVAAGAQVVELGGAGRTDAGVHAAGQTAHLRLAARIDPGAIRRAVNELLAPDIHLLALRPASPRFHARHQAVLRSYVYQVSRRRTAMAKRFVWWIKRPIRVEAIRDAARELVGRRDFSRLCEAPSRQASTVVVVDRVEVAEDGDLILFRFVASHFLWKMVRRTVGALVRVGTGELTGAQWRRLVDPRSDPAAEGSPAAAWTAPPSGLFLERVAYPGEPPLPPLAPVVPVAAEWRRDGGTVFVGDAERRPRGRGGRVGSRGGRVRA